MPVAQLVTLIASLLVAFVLVFAIMGAANIGGSPIAQAIGAAIAAVAGWLGGNAIYARFVAR